MSRPLRILAALAVAAAAAAHAPRAAAQEPARYSPPFPARERGAKAFEPFVSLGGGRRFESREVRRTPRKGLEVSANYPALVGDDRAAARAFNRRARSLVMADVTPYMEAARDPEKERDPLWKDVKEFHRVSHKIIYASDEVVSVLFYVEGYTWGAAHGYRQPVTFNFDLRGGRELTLASLFKPRSGYLRRITGLCAADLVRQREAGLIHGGGYSSPEGLRPRADNFKSWVVTRGGLVFIFEEYAVAPYASGEPKALIPFGRLRDIINPRGALAGLAAEK